MNGWVVAAAAVISGLVTVISVLLNRKASPYDALAARVVALEDKVQHLEETIDGLRFREQSLLAYIRRLTSLLSWHAPGVEIPPLDE